MKYQIRLVDNQILNLTCRNDRISHFYRANAGKLRTSDRSTTPPRPEALGIRGTSWPLFRLEDVPDGI